MKIKVPYQIACDNCDLCLCGELCVQAKALCDTFNDHWAVEGTLHISDEATSSKGWAHIVKTRDEVGPRWVVVDEQGKPTEHALISDYLAGIIKTNFPNATELWLFGNIEGQLYEGAEALAHLDVASGERCSVGGVEGLLCVDSPGHYAMFPDKGGRSVLWLAKDVIRVTDRMDGVIIVEVTK